MGCMQVTCIEDAYSLYMSTYIYIISLLGYGTVKIFKSVMELNLRIMNFVESAHFMVRQCIL
jgi:hypothetical protein